ncbi:MAG: phospho-sugar mutase [Clostridiales bacterium]|nr:phospho-sugar mutase [Clostridiales bacterium]
MDSNSKFEFWRSNGYFDVETRAELESIKDDKGEIEERFYKDLEFGTGGLRGIIGAGTNRINIYTIRKASQGLADFVAEKGEEYKKRGIVIAYDSRFKSPEFALEAAKTFAANGIKAYLSDELRPTPELSFAVRRFGAAAGVVVTASHNPKQYNGYKVYGEDGAQVSLDMSDAVLARIEAIKDITTLKTIDREEAMKKGLIEYFGKEIDDEYIGALKTLTLIESGKEALYSPLRIVYTPLHGAGNKPVRRILDEMGYKDVSIVKEQELPDSDFPTVKYPNPEEKDSFRLAIPIAASMNADVILGTDPDSDRLGVVARNSSGEYVVLTGNQIGCLLMDYVLARRKESGRLPENGFVVKTIVTTEMARVIAKSFGTELVETLTGFKFIGEKIKELDEFGSKRYLFGFEESYGFLAGTFARDKDAVVACMLAAEMTAYYKARGMSLFDAIEGLFKKYGYFMEDIASFTLEGKAGLERIDAAMQSLRESKPSSFCTSEVKAVRDYQLQEKYSFVDETVEKLDLPVSNVLYYEMGGNDWFAVRPSGTEPKIKIYFGISDESRSVAEEKLKKLKECALTVIKSLLFD